MFLRSALFNLAFILWTLIIGISCICILPKKNGVFLAGKIWAGGTLFFLKIFCGITHEVKGRENIPSGPVIIASKHQSAWDTLVLFLLFTRPTYILKRELYLIPIVNFYMMGMGAVAINRKAGAKAIRKVMVDSVKTLQKGNSIVIFPEGTRTMPGAKPHYHSGVAGVYKHAGFAVIPVALNSGLFWPRNSFTKHPGKIIIEILPKIMPGMQAKEFMRVLEEVIEVTSARLCAEASKLKN